MENQQSTNQAISNGIYKIIKIKFVTNKYWKNGGRNEKKKRKQQREPYGPKM